MIWLILEIKIVQTGPKVVSQESINDVPRKSKLRESLNKVESSDGPVNPSIIQEVKSSLKPDKLKVNSDNDFDEAKSKINWII